MWPLQLLTPVQVARCIVQGWPYTPDTLAICSWIAAEDGDAGALAVLTASSRPLPPNNASWGPVSTQPSFPGNESRSSYVAADNRNGFAPSSNRGNFDANDMRARRGTASCIKHWCHLLLWPICTSCHNMSQDQAVGAARKQWTLCKLFIVLLQAPHL